MREKTIQLSSSGQYHPVLFDTDKHSSAPKQKPDPFVFRDFMDRDYYTKPDRYETLTTKYMASIMKHWGDMDFFEKKFDELKEKEMDGSLSELERIILYKVIEKRLLAFPNPFLPSDHEEIMQTKSEYKLIKRQFQKKYGKSK